MDGTEREIKTCREVAASVSVGLKRQIQIMVKIMKILLLFHGRVCVLKSCKR